MTLTAAQAVPADVGWRAVADFEAAVALRTGNVAAVISALRLPNRATQYGTTGQLVANQPAISRPVSAQPAMGRKQAAQASSTQATAAELTAVPVAMTLPLPPEDTGWYGELQLMALVMTDSHAAITIATRWVGQTRRSASPRPMHAPFHPVGAVDDRGTSYLAALWDMGIEDGREWWDCHLGLSHAPAAGIRWLDIGPGAGGVRVRIDLSAGLRVAHDAAAGAASGAVGVTQEDIQPVSPAARLLDSIGDDLLCAGPSALGHGESLGSGISRVIQDLTGSGTVGRDDPALLRLAALAWRLGLDVGVGISGGVVLPTAWASLLVDGDARDGPTGVAAFAVVLPEIDGARFALAGLRSSREGATLHVLAGGWEPRGHGWLTHGQALRGDPPDTSLSWQACDSTGRWHLVASMSWGSNQGMIQMQLTPPLHPAATSIEVIVTGTTGRVRAVVPLSWMSRADDPLEPAGGAE
jgi:hypothetical protein